ncbi:MAG TPA: response regulator [Gemmatimonadales bacterium]|nr:response regulator [Gemmatimonadales bacterium]
MPPRHPGKTTILVVDDDAMMRTLVGRTLRSEGYQVWTASGVPDARQVLSRIPGALDLVLSDVAMPGGMGPQLVADIRQAHPHVRLLYMSSYSRKELLGHGIDLGRDDLLGKPFMPAELIARVRVTLG